MISRSISQSECCCLSVHSVLCAIDLHKAFNKVNHPALYIKLMKRHIPTELLVILENCLAESFACVKWNASWSYVFQVCSGVRQSSALSPLLFAVYVDDVGKLYNASEGAYVIMYADECEF